MSRTINNPTPAAALYLQSAPLYLEGIIRNLVLTTFRLSFSSICLHISAEFNSKNLKALVGRSWRPSRFQEFLEFQKV